VEWKEEAVVVVEGEDGLNRCERSEPVHNHGLSKDQQVTRTRIRQQNKPLTRTQSEQRRNDA